MMKLTTVLSAAVLLATITGQAMAQNTLSPADPMRPGEQGDDSSKPNGLQNNAGTGLPAKLGQPGPDSVGVNGPMSSQSGMTTGSGAIDAGDTLDTTNVPVRSGGERLNR